MVKIDVPPQLLEDARERFRVSDDQAAVLEALKFALRGGELPTSPPGEESRSTPSGPRCRYCNLVIEDAPQWCPDRDEAFCTPDLAPE